MLIGIDPSVNQSGIAVIENNKLVDCFSTELWSVFEFIKKNKDNATFYVENSNLLKSNWHGKTARSNVGKNKGISQTIVNFLIAYECDFVELKPNGYSKVFQNAKVFQKITEYTEQTNKDGRAAAAMIINRKDEKIYPKNTCNGCSTCDCLNGNNRQDG